MLYKRIKNLEEKTDKLLTVLPKLYNLLAREASVYPCEKFKNDFCCNCDKTDCRHNQACAASKTADEIMDEIIKMGRRQNEENNGY